MGDYSYIYFFLPFMGASAILITLGTLILRKNLRIKQGEITKGKVIEIRKSYHQLGDRPHYTLYKTPTVEFTTKEGQIINYTPIVESNLYPYRVGDFVKIAYNPDNPREARILDFVSLYAVPLILLSIGGAFLLLVLIGLPIAASMY